MPEMQVFCFGSQEMLVRPCVDCGQWTGGFCEWCYAKDHAPDEEWAEGQRTPLCSECDNQNKACHFCRGLKACRPPAWRAVESQSLQQEAADLEAEWKADYLLRGTYDLKPKEAEYLRLKKAEADKKQTKERQQAAEASESRLREKRPKEASRPSVSAVTAGVAKHL